MTLKEAWVFLDKWSKEMVITAIEGGADALLTPAGWEARIKELGRIKTVNPRGDVIPGKDVLFERLSSPEDEARIAQLLNQAPVILDVEPKDDAETSLTSRSRTWEVIPLENLVALGGRLFVPVYNREDVALALGILEKGVAGVIIHAQDTEALTAMLSVAKTSTEQLHLEPATIERIRPAGLGDRVCVDTCTMMEAGEGMLVGNSSSLLFLVQAEAKENPYVAPRPFRVNAGPVHAYLRVPNGRTRYLSELEAGDPLLLVSARGKTQSAITGRIKIERRPLLLMHARIQRTSGSILLQNAETIRLTRPDGEALSVVQLKPGDQVLVSAEQAGRHFGILVDETIHEK